MKVTNYLLGYKDLYIVQDSDMFNFSLDSVLLPNFVTINKSCSKILDKCLECEPEGKCVKCAKTLFYL